MTGDFEHTRGARWPLLLSLLVIVSLSLLDALLGPDRRITSTVVIAPLIVSLLGSIRDTRIVGAAAVGACLLSGTWNDNFGDVDYVVRNLVVVVGAAFSLLGARSRHRLARDGVQLQVLSGVAELGQEEGLSVPDAVRRVGDLLIPTLADICVLDVEHESGVRRLAVAVRGPESTPVQLGIQAKTRTAGRARLLARATYAVPNNAWLIDPFDEDAIVALADDDEDLSFLRSLQVRSTMILALRARGRRIGALTLVATADSDRRYTPEDLQFARILAGRVALALDNVGLFTELESLEAQQNAALGSLAEAVTVQNRNGELVYANAAAADALGFGSAAELLAAPAQQIIDAFDSFNEDGSPLRLEQLPGRQVLEGATPQPLVTRIVNRATSEERWRIVKATAVLDRNGRPRLAVNVIEDVTDAKRAELAQGLLADAGAVLASSLDYERTLAEVARLAVPQLCDCCVVSIPDEHGFLRPVAVGHADPDKMRLVWDYHARFPRRVTDDAGPPVVLRDGVPRLFNDVLDGSLEGAIREPEWRAAARALGVRAAMIVPMVAVRGIIGTMTCMSSESGRTFSQADLDLAAELGRRAGIAVENARLHTERSTIARTLQASLLPDALPEMPGFRMASLYRPAGEYSFVGGDFYDAFRTASGWMVVVGDVTGRGPEAAALTAQVRYTLRTAATLLDDPVATVDHLNRALMGRPSLSICTVAIVQLVELEDRVQATVVCGGHPLPLLVRAGVSAPVGESSPIVGAWEDSTWVRRTVDLRDGDVLVLYTDGVLDARGAEDRFGDERLAATVAASSDADDVVRRLRAALDAFERGAQADDTAAVAVQCAIGQAEPRSIAAPGAAEGLAP